MGARFYAAVQTGPGTHPAYYTMGTELLPGAKRQGRLVNHPSPFSADVEEKVEVYFYSPLCLHGRLEGEIYLFTSLAFLIIKSIM